jgi:type II secretory pathway pseudopilin PulG
VNEVGTYCSACGAGNDVRRHFCRRCGTPLVRGPVTNRVPWWRRLFPQRDAPGGDRPFQDETTFGSLVRTFLVTMLIVVVIGGIFAYLALPGFRQAVNREVDIAVTDLRRLINPSYIQVHPVTTSVSSEISSHPGQMAADLINNDYWAADLTRDPQPTLTFTFDGSTDLDALVVTNGAPNPDYSRLARPKTLQISYSDGTGEQVTLKDVPQATAYIIHARGVTSMTVRIVSTYPGDGSSSSVGLAELEFRRLA